MIPERDYLIARDEVRRRREAAANERLAREARREARASSAPRPSVEPAERRAGPFDWLRRLAGAR
jgi:hypothetical protein